MIKRINIMIKLKLIIQISNFDGFELIQFFFIDINILFPLVDEYQFLKKSVHSIKY